MKQKKSKIVVLIIFFAILVFSPVLKTSETNNFYTSATKNTSGDVGEIVENSVIIQTFKRTYERINGLNLQFANYGNRTNKGFVNVKVYDDNNEVANTDIDVSTIQDGQFVYIPFTNKTGNPESTLKINIVGTDSKAGSAVTIWTADNKKLDNIDSNLVINGVESSKSLNLSVDYQTPKVHPIVWGILLVILWLVASIFILENGITKWNSNLQSRKKILDFLFVLGLIVTGFVLVSLRDLSFLTFPSLYAEDATYLNSIFEKGFFESVFTTRSGATADFQNSGSYILLYLALKTTNLFCGYNLTWLPTFIGLYANLFWSLVALAAYKAFSLKSKFIGILSFLIVICIPMGSSGGEVFGRVLNTVFIWPLLIAFLLMIQYQSKKTSILNSIVIGLISIISGLSFPVSYGVIGIYLVFSFFKSLKSKEIKKWFKFNWLQFIGLGIGVWMFPTIIQSKGITTSLTMNPNSIFEFVVGRHILYPFIQLVYNHLNDKWTFIFLIIYIVIVSYAFVQSIKSKGLLSNYVLFFCLTFGVTLSSAIMRIKMTAFFNDYQSSYPDRYFYACNAFCVLLLIYAIHIILNHKKVKVAIQQIVLSFILLVVLANPYLFEYGSPAFQIQGAKNLGDFQSVINQSIEKNTFNRELLTFKVVAYPVFANGELTINVPAYYVWSTHQ